jgi:hypothetical protein
MGLKHDLLQFSGQFETLIFSCISVRTDFSNINASIALHRSSPWKNLLTGCARADT